MSLTLTGVGPPGGFAPSQLAGVKLDFNTARERAAGRLWQDAGKTTPAVANNDPVRVATALTGGDGSSPNDAARPLLKTDGAGHWWLQGDGIQSQWAFPAPSWVGTAGTLAVRFRRTTGNRFSPLSLDVSGQEWFRFEGSGYAQNFRVVRYDAWVTAAPDTSDHTFVQVSGADYRLYVDGVQGGATQATSWSAPTAMSFVFNGDAAGLSAVTFIYGAVVTQSAVSDALRANLETYLRNLSP